MKHTNQTIKKKNFLIIIKIERETQRLYKLLKQQEEKINLIKREENEQEENELFKKNRKKKLS